MNNKKISEIIVDNFELELNVSKPDKYFKKFIGEETWENLRKEVIKHKHGVCQGCKFNSPDKNFNELHVVSGNLDDINSIKFALLCKTCHTLQHIDSASEKKWIKLVNSIYNQKELIAICRSGPSRLMNKIKNREIMTLNTEASIYASSIKENVFNKRKQTKAVFGKNFPKNRLK